MKKTILIFVILLVLGLAILGVYYNNTNSSNPSDNTFGTRISTDVNMENEENRLAELNANHTGGDISVSGISKEISSYSTTIKDKSSGRLVNIRLTCDILNGRVINPGDTFSFNEIVGQPTVERGYQEATVIINHETEKGIGGGNCQVSSTLYNAVLKADGLKVVERHPHSNKVYYVPDGKDAAVAYGSIDFKFKNNNDYNIKIYADSDSKKVNIKLVKII